MSGSINESDKPRVLVSTDIGGTDFDDFQSLVHLLLYSDVLDIEGLIASPWGSARNRKRFLMEVVEAYRKDFLSLRCHSVAYPEPDLLLALCKQGGEDSAGYKGYGNPSEGSQWIISCAHREDSRPLWILGWGGIDDIAQALHDDPSIKQKIRVYWIGGPNKKWSVSAYRYIMANHPDLWIIESNSTYRGWFVGGNMEGMYHPEQFVYKAARDHGALGDYFSSIAPEMKMGDTPSVAYVLSGSRDDPSLESWGGQYVRAWNRDYQLYDYPIRTSTQVETFSVLEFRFPSEKIPSSAKKACLRVDGQTFPGFLLPDGLWRFFFSPKESKKWQYAIEVDGEKIEELSGGFESISPSPDKKHHPSEEFPNWWTDDPSVEASDQNHQGSKSISRWRKQFLDDFAKRFERCIPNK